MIRVDVRKKCLDLMTSRAVESDLCFGPGGRRCSRLRALLTGFLLFTLSVSPQTFPSLAVARAACAPQEEEDVKHPEKEEGKLAAAADGREPSRRRWSSRLSLAALRARTSHTHTPSSTAFAAPPWEHAFRHGTGTPLRC